MAAPFDPHRIFESLAANGVSYLTVGGIALQAHGAQRLTQDLDILIEPGGKNFKRLALSLNELDARILALDGSRSAQPPSAGMLASSDHWQLITVHGPIDAMTAPAHLGRFDELLSRAHIANVEGVEIPIASHRDLLVMKRASNRPQDIEDVRLLESLESVGQSEAPRDSSSAVSGIPRGMSLLSEEEITEKLDALPNWSREGDAITRTFDCGDFVGSVEFVESIVKPAEAMGHHPDLEISWKNVKVKLSTHSRGGLTAADFDLAKQIDGLA